MELGYFACEAAQRVGPTGKVCAIDISPDQVVAAQNEGAAAWLDEFAKLEESGAYFFSITPILTEAVKVT